MINLHNKILYLCGVNTRYRFDSCTKTSLKGVNYTALRKSSLIPGDLMAEWCILSAFLAINRYWYSS